MYPIPNAISSAAVCLDIVVDDGMLPLTTSRLHFPSFLMTTVNLSGTDSLSTHPLIVGIACDLFLSLRSILDFV